ncbi:hypothetical protein [Paenibacillus aquistagni]|uniref:Uncharacterized protein n=1 Tax=Paenibacillus aquistagni TaxID=1852522 RepID=A0A1X7LL18_9BACL|nr:hypothetical protein [Paenibacillus aquistagni]SMG54350.1 hypothetical protein SAMN06295960_3698 [Paenibacillus aquistagni]
MSLPSFFYIGLLGKGQWLDVRRWGEALSIRQINYVYAGQYP